VFNYAINSNNYIVLNRDYSWIKKGGSHYFATFTSDLGDSSWHYVTMTIGSGGIKAYVDGSLEDTDGSITDAFNLGISTGSFIGVRKIEPNYYAHFNGVIDELRVSTVARSIEWIETCFNNQQNPSLFYSIGVEETGHAPIVSDEDPLDGAVNVMRTISQLSFTLADRNGDFMNYSVETSPDIGSFSTILGVLNGSYSVAISDLEPHTSYIWYLNVSDGSYWTNKTYRFTTFAIYDPFAGGGTRAIIAAKKGLKYIGVEVRKKEVLAIKERLKDNNVCSQIIQGDSQKIEIIKDNTADFLITCPPYYDLETYRGGKADLSMAETYDDFLNGIKNVVVESKRILKNNSLSCWVVGLHRDKEGQLLSIPHDIVSIHKSLGFVHKEEVILNFDKNTAGAVRRAGNFEKGQKFLIRNHEYLEIFINKKIGEKENG